MKVMLDSAVVFNITFEHEATSFVDPFTGVAESIGSRMLFEHSDKETPWPYFTAVPDHHVIPSQVIGRVKEGNDVHQDEICVILCVDDLHEVLETRHQTLKQVVECLVNLKKTLKCWVIVAFSALTLSLELKEMITSSATIIPLETTKLRRPTENGVPVFTPKPVKPDIDVQAALEDMLINDMGGFPRALELLAEVLSDQSQSNSDVEFGPVIRQILLGLQVKYRGLKAHMKTLEKAFVAAIAGRIVNKTDTFGSLTVDQIAISGLIRHQNDRFECPYILYLLFDSKTFPWCNGCPYVPSQDRERVKPWQAWEDLNCLFRAIKSMAYDGEIVNWTQLHHGAAFGTDTDIFVHEQTRKYELRVHKTESRSTQGGQASKCCDQAGSFIYRSAAAASCGDAFACLKINEDDYIHEVHQYKHLQRLTGEDSFKEEYEKACGPRDLFVFFATNKVVLPRIPSRCAIVDSTCWKAYYGLFWPRMFFVECIPPPCLNNSSRELLELVSGIGPKRSAEITSMRPFENVKDASSRTSVPKHVLKRLRVTPPKTSS